VSSCVRLPVVTHGVWAATRAAGCICLRARGSTHARSVVFIALLLASSVLSGSAPDRTAGARGTGAVEAGADEVLIISGAPNGDDGLEGLREGAARSEKLVPSGSEALRVARTYLDVFRKKLTLMGAKFAVLADGQKDIFSRDGTRMSSGREHTLAESRSSEMTGANVVRAPEAAVTEYAFAGGPGDGQSQIVIPIGEDKQVTVVRTKVIRTNKGVIWRGVVQDTGESALLLWWTGGRLTGLVGHNGRIYSIVNNGGTVYATLETDAGKMPRDHVTAGGDRRDHREAEDAPPLSAVRPLSAAELQALEARNTTITLMLLYTPRVASHYMLHPADVLEIAVERVNEVFSNSGLANITVRLVHTEPVDYDEQGVSQPADLYRMVDQDGPFKDVRRLRREKRANIVGLVVDDPSGCGLSTRVSPEAEEAYFVVHYSCATITTSIAHEIGHMLGVRHDRKADPSNVPFGYGHGYVNGSKWRDIMSYAESCNGCLRIPYFSNPRVLYKGEPTGTLTEDAARVILEQVERVSKFD
jgi:hypothetical protein